MKKEITKQVWLCDVCGRENGFIATCQICGNEYCCLCEAIFYNPCRVNICKKHQEDEVLKQKMQSFSKRFNKLESDIINKLKKVQHG